MEICEALFERHGASTAALSVEIYRGVLRADLQLLSIFISIQ